MKIPGTLPLKNSLDKNFPCQGADVPYYNEFKGKVVSNKL
jgi:hypothetical protein